MKREAKLQKLISKASEIYGVQPADKKNGKTAAIQALDNGGVTWLPDREWYLPQICSAIGSRGGKTTAARRKQLVFTF